MLALTQLIGFGSGGGGTDATPDAFSFNDIADSGFVASAFTNVATITGIDTTITLRLTLSDPTASGHSVTPYRNGASVGTFTSGTPIDVTITNGQTLQYAFANSINFSDWIGTASVTNLNDPGAGTLDAFTYDLYDVGSPVGVGVGVGVSVSNPIP